MSRRVSLPKADELFRTTAGMALQASTPRRQTNGEPRLPPPAGESDEAAARDDQPREAARSADGGRGGDTADGENAAGEGAGTRDAQGDGDTEQTEHTAAQADQGPGESRSRTADGAEDGEDPGARRARRQLQDGPVPGAGQQGRTGAAPATASAAARKRGRGAGRRPSGRERHDEKITVYVSAEELMDLEHARLVLRGEHGLAVDRGRIVREAVAVVLADLESRGDASILVRRLRGR